MPSRRRDRAPGRPDTPRAFRALDVTLRPVARMATRLAADRLLDRAAARTGLDDFGDPAFREPLRLLTDALESEARLHPIGRMTARTQILGLLTTRLRVHDLLRRRPEIRAEEVASPIVIVGLPRTGTTHLQRLLAADPGLRHLPYWEALAPLPAGDPTVRPADTTSRVRRAEQSLRFLHWAAPELIAMHEMAALAPDEEIWLLAIDFATMLFEASYHVPSFRDWYDAADLTGGYRYLRTLLAILQWYRPGDRWLLESPQHLPT